MIAPAAAEQISPLRGAFVDPELEQAFRHSSWGSWARRVRVTAMIAPVLSLGFSYVDYKMFGATPALALMWSVRLALLATGFGVAWILRRPGSVRTLDTSAMALTLSASLLVFTMVFLQRRGAGETPVTLLCVLGFYLFIPTRFALQVSAALLISIGFLGAQRLWGAPATVEWVSVITQFLLANMLGGYTALSDHVAQRREFLGMRKELEHTRALQASVTALEESNAELAKSNAELEQFAYVASHDLQSPLRSVVSFAQLLKRRYGESLNGEGSEYVDHIVGSASHMHELIQDLLTFSRVGRDHSAFEPVDLDALLRQIVADLSARIAETGARITHDSLPFVSGMSSELRQLLQNLVDNALKFQNGRTPQVHVSARLAGAFWEFTVRDNGIGIKPEHRERIFNMFERLHDRQAYEGTGIGLAICRKVVQQHGGRIWVESQPGMGSTFHFTLRVPTRAG
jgi:signal transduction histidine kinase